MACLPMKRDLFPDTGRTPANKTPCRPPTTTDTSRGVLEMDESSSQQQQQQQQLTQPAAKVLLIAS